MRNGTGTPGAELCRAHKIAMADAAAGAHRAPNINVGGTFQKVSEIFEDFLQGKPFNKQKVATAIDDLIGQWGMGGGYANYQPPEPGVDLGDDGFDPATGNGHTRRPPPGWARDDQARAQSDHERREREVAAAKARVVLGFGPRELVTRDILRARHRQLAKKHHPDRGGSLERMQLINAAVTAMEAVLP